MYKEIQESAIYFLFGHKCSIQIGVRMLPTTKQQIIQIKQKWSDLKKWVYLHLN